MFTDNIMIPIIEPISIMKEIRFKSSLIFFTPIITYTVVKSTVWTNRVIGQRLISNGFLDFFAKYLPIIPSFLYILQIRQQQQGLG